MDALVTNNNRIIRTTVFDTSDGVRLNAWPYIAYGPLVTKSSDGSLWLVSG
jgi:hypothetical protein